MQELAPGLWHWTARHPEWGPEDDAAGHLWGPEISSYALVGADRTTLIDPAIPAAGTDALVPLIDGTTVETVLTCPWHLRDATKLGFRIHAPQAGGDRVEGAIPFAAGDRPVAGVEALPGLEPVDLVLWVPDHGALIFGDTLIDAGQGLELPDGWGPAAVDHGPVIAQLRTYLNRDIRFALPTHGAPADRAALAAAVS